MSRKHSLWLISLCIHACILFATLNTVQVADYFTSLYATPAHLQYVSMSGHTSNTAHTVHAVYTVSCMYTYTAHLQYGVNEWAHWECVLRLLHACAESIQEDGHQELDNTVHIVVLPVCFEQGRGLQKMNEDFFHH